MTEECVFCQIIRQQSPSTPVYEDATVMAFLSNRPINPGHTLVVPKKHSENIFQIDDEEIAHIYKVTKRVSSAVNNAIQPEGVRIVQNNGEAAGQVISHFHVHVIPMYKQSAPFHGEIRERDKLENEAKKIRQFI
jgi:histidine triad (HIT) family protein